MDPADGYARCRANLSNSAGSRYRCQLTILSVRFPRIVSIRKKCGTSAARKRKGQWKWS